MHKDAIKSKNRIISDKMTLQVKDLISDVIKRSHYMIYYLIYYMIYYQLFLIIKKINYIVTCFCLFLIKKLNKLKIISKVYTKNFLRIFQTTIY